MSHKFLHIEQFSANDANETMLSGTTSDGESLTITFSTFEMLEFIDILHMKNKTKQYIENL